MRLFLSSQDFGNHADKLINLIGNRAKVAYIGNAKDDWPEIDRQAKVTEHKKAFETLGCKFREIDLRKFFAKPTELKSEVKAVDLFWVAGGNTFILNRAFHASGLHKIIKDKLKSDEAAYGGSSAGSILATPSLRGTELGDDPNSVPKGYDQKIIWQGLNLVPFYIVPHFESDWFSQEAGEMAAYMQKNHLKYYALKDDQVILIYGEREEFLK